MRREAKAAPPTAPQPQRKAKPGGGGLPGCCSRKTLREWRRRLLPAANPPPRTGVTCGGFAAPALRRSLAKAETGGKRSHRGAQRETRLGRPLRAFFECGAGGGRAPRFFASPADSARSSGPVAQRGSRTGICARRRHYHHHHRERRTSSLSGARRRQDLAPRGFHEGGGGARKVRPARLRPPPPTCPGEQARRGGLSRAPDVPVRQRRVFLASGSPVPALGAASFVPGAGVAASPSSRAEPAERPPGARGWTSIAEKEARPADKGSRGPRRRGEAAEWEMLLGTTFSCRGARRLPPAPPPSARPRLLPGAWLEREPRRGAPARPQPGSAFSSRQHRMGVFKPF